GPPSPPRPPARGGTGPGPATPTAPSWPPRAGTVFPAASPAIDSSWPKKDIPPHCCQLATPALNMTTGIPAATAFLIVGQMAAGLGSVTAMPSTLLLIASWIRVACLVGSWLLE